MTWISSLSFLAVAASVSGITIGTLSNSLGGGNNVSTLQQISSPSHSRQLRKDKLLKELSETKSCYPEGGLKKEDTNFGIVYFCAGALDGDKIPLYYLEEESALDSLDQDKELISLLKKIEKFQYKQDNVERPHLLITFEGKDKKIFIENSYSKDWSQYSGFFK